MQAPPQRTPIPAIALPGTDGTLHDLSAQKGRALLIVYPFTGRPGAPNPPHWDEIEGAHGSTPELAGFRDHAAGFAYLGVDLFGLSRQTTAYQQELVARLKLPFPILSDHADRFWPKLGLDHFTTGGEVYLKRITFLIEQGRVAQVFQAPDPAGHAASVLAALSAA